MTSRLWVEDRDARSLDEVRRGLTTPVSPDLESVEAGSQTGRGPVVASESTHTGSGTPRKGVLVDVGFGVKYHAGWELILYLTGLDPFQGVSGRGAAEERGLSN